MPSTTRGPRRARRGALVLLVLILLVMAVRRAGGSADLMTPMIHQMNAMGQRVESLTAGQQQLAGGLTHVSEAQAASQAQMLRLMETASRRGLDPDAGEPAGHRHPHRAVAGRAAAAARHDRPRAGQHREAVGRRPDPPGHPVEQADARRLRRDPAPRHRLEGAAADAYALQATLSNGRRADCLIHLPNPPGPIVIDAKFPLEAYEALRAAKTQWETSEATKAFRTAVRKHVKDIAERYVIEGETADGALMFLPSEAVYAELHANHAEIVREGFAARVWIVSPTTCMATLNTMRAILKDARMREQAGAIRKTLRQLHRDVEMVVERVGKLDTHFRQAREDLDGITTAAERAGKRAERLDNFDFEELAPDEPPLPLKAGE
jgi:DNA recombination protein RmuC